MVENSKNSRTEKRKKKKKKKKLTILILFFTIFFILLSIFIVSTLDDRQEKKEGFSINEKIVDDFNPKGDKQEYSDNNVGKKMCLEVPSFVISQNDEFELFIKNSGDYDSIPKIDLLNEETGDVYNLFETNEILKPQKTLIVNVKLNSLKGNKLYIYDNSSIGQVGVKYLIPIKKQ